MTCLQPLPACGGGLGWGFRRAARRHVAELLELREEAGVAILPGEAEALREVGAHLVAVEDLDVDAAAAQLVGEQAGEGALPRARQPREPDDEPAHIHAPFNRPR